MSVLILLIILSLLFSLGALVVFMRAQKQGQFDLLSSNGQGQGAELPLLDAGETHRFENRSELPDDDEHKGRFR
jgi:cbb3-type cytochrome oxidase maturation protein